jgi:hypothetical protein
MFSCRTGMSTILSRESTKSSRSWVSQGVSYRPSRHAVPGTRPLSHTLYVRVQHPATSYREIFVHNASSLFIVTQRIPRKGVSCQYQKPKNIEKSWVNTTRGVSYLANALTAVWG